MDESKLSSKPITDLGITMINDIHNIINNKEDIGLFLNDFYIAYLEALRLFNEVDVIESICKDLHNQLKEFKEKIEEKI